MGAAEGPTEKVASGAPELINLPLRKALLSLSVVGTRRIHCVLTRTSFSISQNLQGMSATTKSKLVFSILFAWNNLQRKGKSYIMKLPSLAISLTMTMMHVHKGCQLSRTNTHLEQLPQSCKVL